MYSLKIVVQQFRVTGLSHIRLAPDFKLQLKKEIFHQGLELGGLELESQVKFPYIHTIPEGLLLVV